MNPQEAQQAQAIATVKKYANSNGREEGMVAIEYRVLRSVVSVVDSQAQKIAEQAKEIEKLRNVTNAISFGTYTALEVRLHMEKLADFDAARMQK